MEHETDDSENTPTSATSGDLDIALGATRSLILSDVCTSLPPRPIVDKLLSVYFNTMHSQTRKHAASADELLADHQSDPSYG